MIKIETIEVSGFYGAILGMRNPFKNREKSDSIYKEVSEAGAEILKIPRIGLKDLELCQKLLGAGGDDDSKFMRYIHVQADVNAPLYWWKEFDTYKVSTVANSESTMHTIHKREFTLDDFSWEMLDSDTLYDCYGEQMTQRNWAKETIDLLNHTRERYLKAVERKDPQSQLIWYQLIQLLPSSYMQKRTVDLNYQTLRRIFFARMNHKLDEWSGDDGFCGWIKTLPYAEELITYVAPTATSKEMLRRIKNFSVRAFYDPEVIVDEEHGFNKEHEMCHISRLITDMTIKGATREELENAVMHSIVIIDAQKMKLNWLKSEAEFDILGLEKKYGSKGEENKDAE